MSVLIVHHPAILMSCKTAKFARIPAVLPAWMQTSFAIPVSKFSVQNVDSLVMLASVTKSRNQSMTNPIDTICLDPLALDSLYNKDPRELTDNEMDIIISAIRKERAEGLAKRQATKTKKSVDKKLMENLPDLDLSSIRVEDL